MIRNPNFVITEEVARRLGPLLPEFVFVGGCATGLFITDPASAPVRATRDVDVIAELASYGQYAGLGERLRKQGFSEDRSEGAPVCRWAIGDMLLDVMPASGKVLGFTNEWYAEAVKESREFKLTSKLSIRLIGPPYFLATKFVAFHSRGRRDFYTSHDLEDIITVVDGREELFGEIERARVGVKQYLSGQFSELLKDEEFIESLPGNFPPDDISQERVGLVLARIKAIAAIRQSS